jgi:pimeloyl-ACP methyl ester carboxylesterase
MKMLLSAAAALVLLAAGGARAEDAAGDWAGTIAGQLHLVLHLTRGSDGKLTGLLESIDQGDAKIPLGAVDATPDHLTFTVPAVGGSYDGAWDEARKQWTGTWTQGQSIALNLHRATAADRAVPKRPQDEAIDRGPLPYGTEPVSFGNARAGGVTLSGTFSKPRGAGPFPAVVLIAGSGPNTRDEAVAGHKIFLVLADYFSRQGLAVLRYDKRGAGASSGDYAAATTADFISDAEAAVAYLKTRGDVDTKHIGLVGHSEGGLIAPAVAVADPGVAFVVLMAGPGVRGDKVLLKQGDLISRANGMSEADIARGDAQRAQAFAIVEGASSPAEAKARLDAIAAQAIAAGRLRKDAADQSIAQVTSPWLYSFLRYDPAPALQKVRVPVLAVGGSLDLQVEPKENLAAIKAALKDDPDATVIELPGLNHLFQDAATGAPGEYERIEETVSPTALKVIGDWIVAHVK